MTISYSNRKARSFGSAAPSRYFKEEAKTCENCMDTRHTTAECPHAKGVCILCGMHGHTEEVR